jgi:hypothetical protein
MKKSKRLRKARGEAAASSREKRATVAREKALAALPAAYGFASVRLFAAAVERACGLAPQSRAGAAGAGRGARPRRLITAEMRARVKQRLDAGASGVAVARRLGISRSSVQAIKRALGMVRLCGGSHPPQDGVVQNHSPGAGKVLAFPVAGGTPWSPPG